MIGTMPRYVRPDHAALLEAAIEAFGNRVSRPYHRRARRSRTIYPQGAPSSPGRRALKALFTIVCRRLEKIGVVVSDPLPEQRVSAQGGAYSINTDR